MELLFKELTYQIKGFTYDVQNELRVGFDEETYHEALKLRLDRAGISYISKATKYLKHRGIHIHKFQLDLLVADKVVLELKNIQSDFHPAHFEQIISYQKYWKKELGLLINFGLPKVKTKRVIFKEVIPIISENYEEIKPLINQNSREHLANIRAIILDLLDKYGLGFNDKIYGPIFQTELSYRNINNNSNVVIPVTFEGNNIRSYKTTHSIVENQILCGIVALKKDVMLEILKIQTYLRMLNLPMGLLIHFGKKELQIFGVRP